MTCKDCVHYEVCKFIGNLYSEDEKCRHFKPKSRFVELLCEENELLQEAINVMNGIDEYHRCWICDSYKSGSCDRVKYIHCAEFTWNGITPTGKIE